MIRFYVPNGIPLQNTAGGYARYDSEILTDLPGLGLSAEACSLATYDLSAHGAVIGAETPQPAFDAATQKVVEVLPVLVNGTWTQQWSIVTGDLAAYKMARIVMVDSDTDSIYGAVLGNRGIEYQDAGVAAQAFKDAGYSGAVPGEVHSWATAKGWTDQAAADDILATATAWKSAQAAIRANRLATKEAVRNASTGAAIGTAMTAWAGFVAYIRGQLGV